MFLSRGQTGSWKILRQWSNRKGERVMSSGLKNSQQTRGAAVHSRKAEVAWATQQDHAKGKEEAREGKVGRKEKEQY